MYYYINQNEFHSYYFVVFDDRLDYLCSLSSLGLHFELIVDRISSDHEATNLFPLQSSFSFVLRFMKGNQYDVERADCWRFTQFRA